MQKYIDYIKAIYPNDSDLLKWGETQLTAYLEKNPDNQTEVEHILDYLGSKDRPKSLLRVSYSQALVKTNEWVDKQHKEANKIVELPEDTKTVLDFKDGFKIVQLIGENAYKREGLLMSHCVASYYGRDTEVYSLRDEFNNPHCTMEKDQQIKGKGNGSIDPKYIKYVVKFLEKMDMTVGDNEMLNLGYVNISDIKDKNAVFSPLFDKKYFYKNNKIADKNGNPYQSITLWEKFNIFDLDAKLNIKWNFDINLSIETFISNFVKSKVKTNTGYQSAATNTGNQSAATNTGDRSAATNTGNQSAATNTGDRSAATNTGNQSAATNTGNQSAATNTGNQSAATNTGDRSAATNTGNQSAATNTGDWSAATNTGDRSAATNTGYQSAATNTGNQSAATNTGNQSAATNTGDRSAATNTGNQSAATNTGDRSAATNTGYQSAATNTGNWSAATNTGNWSAAKVTQKTSVAFVSGFKSKASGCLGSWIVVTERKDTGDIISVKSAKIDGKILKADTWYTLENGEFEEVK